MHSHERDKKKYKPIPKYKPIKNKHKQLPINASNKESHQRLLQYREKYA